MRPEPTPPRRLATSAREGALQALRRIADLEHLVASRIGATATEGDVARSLPASVLVDLALAGRRRPAEIQQRTGLTSGGVTKLLDRLEAQGLVARAFGQVPGDRRAILVSLTPPGRAAADRFADALLAGLDEIRDALDEAAELLDEAGEAPVRPAARRAGARRSS